MGNQCLNGFGFLATPKPSIYHIYSYIIYHIYIYPIPTIFHYHHGPPLGPHGSRIGAPFASPHHAAAAPSRGCSAPHGGGIGGWQGEHHFPGSSAFFGSLMARFSSATEMISFFWLFFLGGMNVKSPSTANMTASDLVQHLDSVSGFVIGSNFEGIKDERYCRLLMKN